MGYNIDARIGLEEFYGDPFLLTCDNCQDNVPPEHVHYMDNFDDKPTLIICNSCYKHLLNGNLSDRS